MNGYAVQAWRGDEAMKEIVVIGLGPNFASQRDSGGFLAVEDVGDGTRRAAGAAMGKIFLICVTPLQTIIADSEQEFDRLKWARPLGSDDVWIGKFVIFLNDHSPHIHMRR